MKPTLTKSISIDDLRNYYWLKTELQAFCRQNGIRTTSSKSELLERIDYFLRNEEMPLIRISAKISEKTQPNHPPLSVHTIINDNHRCSQEVRAFFKSIIPNFHFSTFIQNYFKTNVGKSYGDAVNAWYEEEKRKKDPQYQKEIAPQFEYNQFIRDYFTDPNNKGKSRGDAIAAWNVIKQQPGNRKYKPIESNIL